MKKMFLFVVAISILGFDQIPKMGAYDIGENLRFKISYGFVNSGFATLEIQEAVKNDQKVFHAVGKGYTTGMTKFFFKVEDDYQSFIDKKTNMPHQYIRKIDEGGYTKNQHGFFNHKDNTVLAIDNKSKTERIVKIPDNTQDILSSFYYLRNYPGIENLKVNESIGLDMFFDEEITKFKLKFLGREDLKTKFGIVPCMIFRPLVQSGRVFKEQESLTVWISDDLNKIPLKIKAELAVGSLKAEIDYYKGLKHPFVIKNK
jgi:hypothetical protein